jgi:hypothetical protein
MNILLTIIAVNRCVRVRFITSLSYLRTGIPGKLRIQKRFRRLVTSEQSRPAGNGRIRTQSQARLTLHTQGQAGLMKLTQNQARLLTRIRNQVRLMKTCSKEVNIRQFPPLSQPQKRRRRK